MSTTKKIKVNDRVKRVGNDGPRGIVKDIREEVTTVAVNQEGRQMITVLWDNGTQSCFSPESLETVKE